MKRIYIAGPISKGDQALNVREAIDAANELLEAGYAPYVPHLTWFWHMVHFHAHETWMEFDDHWLQVCEALVRLPGESAGADREEARAEQLGIPVYGSVEGFLAERGHAS